MTKPNPVELKSQDHAIEFYEEFFNDRENYLESWWTPHQFVKLKSVLDTMGIVPGSRIFDFGCGVGDVTGHLAALLPGCAVTGSDISRQAVGLAAARHPEIRFVTRDDALKDTSLYDVVFSHHVFEHVVDLDTSFQEVAAKLKPEGKILIVVPCGNPGSLEHSIASCMRNGIDPNQGNRFLHEGMDHQRRLRTEDLDNLASRNGFRVVGRYYAEQYWGGLEWIARGGRRFLEQWARPEDAASPEAAERLARIRRPLLFWSLTNGLFEQLKYKLRQKRKTPADWIKIAIGIMALPVSYPAHVLLWSRVRREWRDRKTDPAAGEMWFVFERERSNP